MNGAAAEAMALLQRGAACHQARRLGEAEQYYREALRRDPGNPEALCLLGMIAGEAGQFRQAAEFFRRALKRARGRADIHHNLGETYRHLGEFQNAIQALRRAIELKPDLLDAYRSAVDAAREAAERATKAGQDKAAREARSVAAQYLGALGHELLRQGASDRAEAAFREALALGTERAVLHTGYARVLFDQGRLSEAEEHWKRALALEPHSADTHAALGTTLFDQERFADAEAAYRQALALDPGHRTARQGMTALSLFIPLYRETEPARIFEVHRRCGEEIMATLGGAEKQAPFANPRFPDRPLRVGFVSPDLRQHSVAYFLEPLLAHLDRAVFETFCYAEVKRPDAVTERLKGLARHWWSTVGVSDELLRRQVRQDQIDLLIDVAGHMVGNRLSALAAKPAPVTATWLGYPATTGLPMIDWRITDALADPPGAERFHTERLWRLPGAFLCYQPPADAPAISPLPALSTGRITFGSFNNPSKLSDETVALWARVLESVPRSRLLLKAKTLADPSIRERFIARFEAHEIDRDRIELRPFAKGTANHLATYGEVDVALDPFPYNGTTTTCEAVWMGVPVITLVGSQHAGRVGLSLLSQMGLDQFIARSGDDYVAAAAELTRNLEALACLRHELRRRMAASPLCDASRFARSFEAALCAMWRDWCENAA